MSFCLGAPWQNVLLLQLSLAGSVPQFDVQGVSSADLNGQRALNRNETGRTSHRRLRAFMEMSLSLPSVFCNFCLYF